MKKLYSLFIIAAAVLVGCNKESLSDGKVAEPEAIPADVICFTAEGEGIGASVATRATAVTSLSSFNVNCVTGTLGSSESSVFNTSFFGGPTYTGGQFWPVTDPSYKFYASNVAITPSASGPTVAASNATDVVCAVKSDPTYKVSNALVFDHIFARLGDVTITAASGYTVTGISITITPKTGGTYNLYTGNGQTDGTGWSSLSTGSSTGIANATPGTKSNDIYLVPGTYTLTATWTATRGESVQTFSGKTQTVALTAGKINTISATLGGSASEIQLTVSINPWGTENKNVSFSLD